MKSANVQANEAEEIDLTQTLSALRRRWKFLLAGAAAGSLGAIFVSATTPVTWEGSFDVVHTSRREKGGGISTLASNPVLASLSPLGAKAYTSELETDIKVLQSSLVLKPVFDELIGRKVALGEDVDDLDFDKWADSITISLAKGTSVLSVKYQGENKDEILTVLGLLSKAYQDYSLDDRNQSIEDATKFAEKQVEIFREKASESFRATNLYGLSYGISSQNLKNPSTNIIQLGSSRAGINNTTAAQNAAQAAAQTNTGKNESSGASSAGDPLAQLAKLNQDLIRKQETFTDNDPSIIALKRERNALQKYIESSIFGSIAYSGNKPLSKEQAQKILLRHSELNREANRDQSILDSMESALLSLRLDLARSSKPWKVIASPTVSDKPIAPLPTRNLGFGIFMGIVLGTGAGLIVDRRLGRIFSKETLSELLPAKLLLELKSNTPENTWKDALRLLGLESIGAENIAILPLGDSSTEKLSLVTDYLRQICGDKIILCETILEARAFDVQVLIAWPGCCTKDGLELMTQQLSLQKTPTLGWIWLGN